MSTLPRLDDAMLVCDALTSELGISRLIWLAAATASASASAAAAAAAAASFLVAEHSQCRGIMPPAQAAASMSGPLNCPTYLAPLACCSQGGAGLRA